MLIIQGLYAWLISDAFPKDLEEELLSSHYFDMFASFEADASVLFPPIKQVDEPYFREILKGILQKKAVLDALLLPHLDRALEKLGPIEHAVLLLGAYELTFRQDVPYKVAINESIDLAKLFGAQDSHKYINGVLDRLAQDKKTQKTDQQPA